MGLRDVTHVVFDRGTGPFNEAAALEAYHLVAKMDEADAAEFVFHVVNEVVENTITNNVELVQKHLDRTIAKALVYTDLDAVAAGLNAQEREEVKKQLLGAVSKASQAEEFAWSQRDKKGRFRTFKQKVEPGGKLSPEAGKALGIPKHPEHEKLSTEQRAAFRAQYLAVAAALDEFGGFDGDNDVRLRYTDGSSKVIVAANPKQVASAINPHDGEDVDEIEIRPYKPTIGDQVADLTGSLGAGVGTMSAPAGKMKPVGQGSSGFTQQWYSASPTDSSQQMFNRIGAGSQVLDAMSVGQPKLKAAATFGSFVGQHGAQAEQVFGPPARRMAYRYRGTERRPDPALVAAYADAINSTKSSSGKHTREQNAERPPDWSERRAGREQVINWLRQPNRAPSRQLSNLQLAAGHTPPSEGVLINADGQIVTTAVGAADDWYLPFNLRHLQSLKGGEYIRSRSTGGLTTEDVYTGLMAGARRVTVVSRSGVYTLEFDPEMRGGRRNNDKALRMSRRYAELLDAVQSGKVERQSLAPEDQREIAAEVDAMFGSAISPRERTEHIEALIKERKENPASIDAKIDQLDQQIEAITAERELVPDERADFDRKRLSLVSQKEYFYRLNGLGYEAAQKALKEQFPYYIADTKATYTLDDQILGSNDKGYVEPGALRPTAARANLFGGAKGSGQEVQPFMSARRADRAIPIVDRYGRPGGAAGAVDEDPDEPQGPSGSGGAGRPAAVQNDSEAFARVAKQKAQREAAVEVHGGLDSWTDVLTENGKAIPGAEDLIRFRQMSPVEFAQAIRKDSERAKFVAAVRWGSKKLTDQGYPWPGRSKFEDAFPQGGGSYSFDAAKVAPNAVFDFESLSAEKKRAAGDQPLALSAKTAAQASAQELADDALFRSIIGQALEDYPDSEFQGVTHELREAGMNPDDQRVAAMVKIYSDPKRPQALQDSMEKIQIQRYLNSSGGSAPAAPAAPTPAALPAAPLGPTRHDGKTPLTEKEQREGWYWDDADQQRRYL